MSPLSVTPVVGLPRFDGWSQVVSANQPRLANLICAFAVYGHNAGNVGRDLSSLIQDQRSLSSGREFYNFIELLLSEAEQREAQLALAAGFFQDKTSTLATYNGQILLSRDSKVGTVVKSEDSLRLVTGQVREQDVFVLLSKQAHVFVNEIEQKIGQGYDLDTIITSIVPALHNQDQSAYSVLAFVTQSTSAQKPQQTQAAHRSPQDLSQTLSVSQVLDKVNAQRRDLTSSRWIKFKDWWSRAQDWWSKARLIGINMASSSQKFAWRMASWFKTWLSTKKSGWQSQGLGVYVQSRSSLVTRKRRLILLVIGLILLLTLGWWSYDRHQRRSAAQEMTAPFYQSLEQAQDQVVAEPLVARASVEQTIAQLESLMEVYQNDNLISGELSQALSQALLIHDSISGREEWQELEVFYDLRSASPEFLASSASIDGQRVAFLDSERRQLIVLELSNQQARVFDLDFEALPRDVRLRGNQTLILADGLYALDTEDGSWERVVPEGDSNREAHLVGVYDQFLYVFNASQRNIYRYAPVEDGYSRPIGWLQSPRGLVFDDVVHMTIDGDIWLAGKNGEIRRFSRGQAVEFEISGLEPAFTQALALETQTDLDELYVLETDAHRLVVLDKDGAFLREIISPSLAVATDILLYPNENKILAVSGSLVFEVDLQ